MFSRNGMPLDQMTKYLYFNEDIVTVFPNQRFAEPVVFTGRRYGFSDKSWNNFKKLEYGRNFKYPRHIAVVVRQWAGLKQSRCATNCLFVCFCFYRWVFLRITQISVRVHRVHGARGDAAG
jgi:hypothetical protein